MRFSEPVAASPGRKRKRALPSPGEAVVQLDDGGVERRAALLEGGEGGGHVAAVP